MGRHAREVVLTASGQRLAEDHIRYAYWVARPYRLACPRLSDDIASVARMALCRAAALDDGREGSFRGYLRRTIEGAIITFLRKDNDAGLKAMRADGKLRPDAPGRVPFGFELDPDVPSDESAVDDRDEAEVALAEMPPKVAMASRLVYLDGLTRKEAAAVMGYSQAYVGFLLDYDRRPARPTGRPPGPRPATDTVPDRPRGRQARWMAAAIARTIAT